MPCPEPRQDFRRLNRWLLAAVVLALITPPAWAQPSAPAITVPLGDTALVDNPCPPPLGNLIKTPAEPGKPAVYVDGGLEAYRRYADWRLANDWAYLCHYRADNQVLMAAKVRPRVVFMGDSITENWARYDPAFLDGKTRAGRGISGQTSPQMLARFTQDVVRLNPRVVHIMAGTNDVAGNTGPTSEADFKANIEAMVDLATAHRIKVVLASIPPAKGFSWKTELKPSPTIVALNAWLRSFAKDRGLVYADYYGVLAEPDGALKTAWTNDGVHPTSAGYAAMKTVAEKAIAQAEAKAR